MRFIKLFCLLISCSFISPQISAQGNKNISATEKKILDQGLVDIQSVNPEILVELKYATPDNFMKKNVYGDLTHAYLQPEIAKRLSKASSLLKKAKPGYKLLVYDAARPNTAQYKLWDALDDLKIPARQKTQYVADPKIGSNHNFGCAIDLTVVDEKGNPLDMGTKYDFFGPLAYPRSEQEMLRQGKLTTKQIANRNILRMAMVHAGFTVNTTEWWHFDGMSKKQARAKYGMIK
ncbi:M15 family metallopeptidase [Dyadobacter sp. CY345]|uniref:M15 family metallopeptidase n=1 Tax=Dyadobacter sp. CY345 TaxID=2909335 RepID=UPI001F29A2B9|nr:M15 family metallopeptidase [Dyadobacter sp. CY345]MCF2444533.1 M15 family metallopeptidase [Dyadobacter sp. CY345]